MPATSRCPGHQLLRESGPVTRFDLDTHSMSEATPAQPCDVCGALIPERLAVFTMRDALAGPVIVMCRACAALDEQVEDAVESDGPGAASP